MISFRRTAASLRRATIADCDELSDIHSDSFSRGWSSAEFESLLVQTGTHALLAEQRSIFGRRSPAGFVLYRLVADEAEVLTVAVARAFRGRGVGRALLDEALRHAYREGAERIYLEVEDTNRAAIALYRRAEFRETGRREGYYREGRAAPGGALVMLRQLR
jgi:[ribosomal protein S18]-alanine N-acetyltransferase